MHVSGIRFPLRSLNSRAKSSLYLLAGPQGRSAFCSKEKNRFPCRQLSPGCPGCIHDEVTISNHKTIHYWIFLNQTTLCAIHYVTFTAHHEGSDDRERPWQWPVYRTTSCSKRHMSAAALVRGAHLYRPVYFRLFSFFLQCTTLLKFCPGLHGAWSCLVLPCIDSRLVLQTRGAEAVWLLPAYRRT